VPVAEANAPAKHDEGFSFKKVGDDLVPDYMTSVRDGAFYGWPYSYFGQNVDERVRPQRPDLVPGQSSPIMRWAPIPRRSD